MKNILWKIKNFFCNYCHLAVLDEQKGRWYVKAEAKNIPYLKAENAGGRHILIKPDSKIEPYYLLADDINLSLLNRHHKSDDTIFKNGRMVVETSPGNYQVWIHSGRRLILDEKRYWLKKLFSDPGADPHNRWGRAPGFRNRKMKHRTSSKQYPLARLIWVDWKNRAIIPEISLKTIRPKEDISHLPQGEVCHNYILSRTQYDKGDESATDFAYALALIRRGFSITETSHRILAQRQDWKNHKGTNKRENYLQRTISKAARIIANS